MTVSTRISGNSSSHSSSSLAAFRFQKEPRESVLTSKMSGSGWDSDDHSSTEILEDSEFFDFAPTPMARHSESMLPEADVAPFQQGVVMSYGHMSMAFAYGGGVDQAGQCLVDPEDCEQATMEDPLVQHVREFVEDRLDTFSRNVDFVQGQAEAWTRNLGNQLSVMLGQK